MTTVNRGAVLKSKSYTGVTGNSDNVTLTGALTMYEGKVSRYEGKVTSNTGKEIGKFLYNVPTDNSAYTNMPATNSMERYVNITDKDSESLSDEASALFSRTLKEINEDEYFTQF